jgi:hypothetical protein
MYHTETQKLSGTGKKTDLNINAEKTKYMFMLHQQNTGQNVIQ